MPKKAIVASSRGKGIRLALPGPIKQSQSGYESGSSTQQPAQKSTKQSSQSKNEAGPSTQQPKPTKADCAFPIQTLMALQDQGVTKLNKKSWAEICSESDEDIDLTQLLPELLHQSKSITETIEDRNCSYSLGHLYLYYRNNSLFLNIRIHGLNMKEGSIPAALVYRIQYKVMNTCNSRVLLKSSDRETTLFVTDMTKANVTVPRL
ncbi:hypothetical protein PIB30_101670 [Stylosanthes scabra]|uniref:Uncharacterized protein n=1 Tax=Stylosanthes scabra TaxID=79078 RepID=A0ABU6RXD2_9FABA|nr:hypothetical protein [Stylosanthes scabra]